MNDTTTNVTQVYTWTATSWTTAKWTTVDSGIRPMTKEEKRAHASRERTRKWLENCRKTFEASLAARIKQIEERIEANRWRPEVSHRQSNDFAMSWWSLGRTESDEGDPKWRTWQSRYDRNWVGLTICSISPYERFCIDNCIKHIPKKDVICTGWEEYDDNHREHGTYDTNGTGYWFRNLEDHNRFVAMLEAIPERTQIIEIGENYDRGASKRYLKGENHWVIACDRKTVVSMQESSNAVLMKLFLT